MQVQLSHYEGWTLEEGLISLLRELISIPSFSGEEDKTAGLISAFLSDQGVEWHRKHNNVWAFNRYYNPVLPTVLLNSHHDTVRPASGYTMDPFTPVEKDGKLYGLGSNDAGGALVALLAAFLHFYHRSEMTHNLLFAATAEEEVSGPLGLSTILKDIGPIESAIVGEPTGMRMATSQKGLIVLDCKAHGTAAHVANGNGENAIYKAMEDISWFRSFSFPRVSAQLGPVKMTVTAIKAGNQHNVVPGECGFTVDVRTTDAYRNEEVLEIIREHVRCEVTARSLRLQPSSISPRHSLVRSGLELGLEMFGSPTLSDSALIPAPALKVGPGDSARSHTADEFIYLDEIRKGMAVYRKLLERVITGENNSNRK